MQEPYRRSEKKETLKPLALFLERFKEICRDKEEEERIMRGIIESSIHKKIPNLSIVFNGSSVHVSASPIERSEIVLHKKDILSMCEKMLNRKIQDILFTNKKK